MPKALKIFLIIVLVAAYIVGAGFVAIKLPFLMSGGDAVTQDILEGGQTANYYSCTFIDGGNVNPKEVIYSYSQNDKNMCTRSNISSTTSVIVVDNVPNENGQIVVKPNGASVNDGKFSFGIRFLQIILFLILILVPIFIIVSKGGFSSLNLGGGGGGKKKVKITTKYGNQGTAQYGNINELNRIKFLNIEEHLSQETDPGTFKEILDMVYEDKIIPLIDNAGNILGISVDPGCETILEDSIAQAIFEKRYCCRPVMPWVLKALECKAIGKVITRVVEDADTGEVIITLDNGTEEVLIEGIPREEIPRSYSYDARSWQCSTQSPMPSAE